MKKIDTVKRVGRASTRKALVSMGLVVAVTAALVFSTKVQFTVPVMGATHAPSQSASSAEMQGKRISALENAQVALEKRVTDDVATKNWEKAERVVAEIFASVDLRIDRVVAVVGQWATRLRIENMAKMVATIQMDLDAFAMVLSEGLKDRPTNSEVDERISKSEERQAKILEERLTGLTEKIEAAPTPDKVEKLVADAIAPLRKRIDAAESRVDQIESDSKKHGSAVEKVEKDLQKLSEQFVPTIVTPRPSFQQPACQPAANGLQRCPTRKR